MLIPYLQLAEADLATTARETALQLNQTLQHSTRNAADTLTRFVEGDAEHPSSSSSSRATARGTGLDADKRDFWDSFGAPPAGPSSDKKDFWDEFAAAGEVRQQQQQQGVAAPKPKPTSIGTAAMRKGGPGAGAAGSPQKGKEDDGWGDW